uniref:Uncharacterized protein n=1 Tax=Arundo donax TaxID=35708 RepID=A0A0A8ZNV2_ARUDO
MFSGGHFSNSTHVPERSRGVLR